MITPLLSLLRNPLHIPTMQGGMLRAKNRGLAPQTVIDVGAATGTWTADTLKIWPDANYLLFEPLPQRRGILEALAKKNAAIHFVPAGAGSSEGEIAFYVTADLDGSGIADNGTNATKTVVPVSTLDIETASHNLPGPYLVKLDTHGYEVPILEGAAKVLPHASLVIIECYGYQIAPNSLLFWEMCQYMDNLGFRLADVVDTSTRPKDGTFWQCDAFFEPKNLPYFQHNTFHY